MHGIFLEDVNTRVKRYLTSPDLNVINKTFKSNSLPDDVLIRLTTGNLRALQEKGFSGIIQAVRFPVDDSSSLKDVDKEVVNQRTLKRPEFHQNANVYPFYTANGDETNGDVLVQTKNGYFILPGTEFPEPSQNVRDIIYSNSRASSLFGIGDPVNRRVQDTPDGLTMLDRFKQAFQTSL